METRKRCEARHIPFPTKRESRVLGSPACHAFSLSHPKEADPYSLPSPDSSPPVSICSQSTANPGLYNNTLSQASLSPGPTAPLERPSRAGPPCLFTHHSPTTPYTHLITCRGGENNGRELFSAFGKQIYLSKSGFLKMILK